MVTDLPVSVSLGVGPDGALEPLIPAYQTGAAQVKLQLVEDLEQLYQVLRLIHAAVINFRLRAAHEKMCKAPTRVCGALYAPRVPILSGARGVGQSNGAGQGPGAGKEAEGRR
eukprot:1897123-Rhodomonas_salina.7